MCDDSDRNISSSSLFSRKPNGLLYDYASTHEPFLHMPMRESTLSSLRFFFFAFIIIILMIVGIETHALKLKMRPVFISFGKNTLTHTHVRTPMYEYLIRSCVCVSFMVRSAFNPKVKILLIQIHSWILLGMYRLLC